MYGTWRRPEPVVSAPAPASKFWKQPVTENRPPKMATPRKSAVRFRERSELLDFLLEVSAATSETLDLDRLLANVGDIVKKVVECELFAILLYNERSQDLRIRFAVGHRTEIVDNLTLTLNDGITGAAA